jgi:Domain of unknown function (DUF4942)
MSHSDVADLVPSVSITAILERRQAVVERLGIAHKAAQEIRQLESAFGDFTRFRQLRLEDRSGPRTLDFLDEGSLPHFIRRFDAAAWDYLMHESGLRSFMDAARRREWDMQVYEARVPELTLENIRATFMGLHSRRQELLEQGVIAVFRSLSWHYKTNCPRRFGRRIILKRAVSTYRGKLLGGPEHHAAESLDDLVRVFSLLDGKPEPDHRQGCYHRLNAACWPQGQQVADLFGYLSVRGFRNGNAHVTFLRRDLIDELNQILAKHYPNALPPA